MNGRATIQPGEPLSLVHSDRSIVATIGVDDLIIVNTPGARWSPLGVDDIVHTDDIFIVPLTKRASFRKRHVPAEATAVSWRRQR